MTRQRLGPSSGHYTGAIAYGLIGDDQRLILGLVPRIRIVPRRQVAQRQEAPPVDRPPATATTAPPAFPALSSSVPAAPAPQASSASLSNAMPTW